MRRGDDWHRRHVGALSAARFQRGRAENKLPRTRPCALRFFGRAMQQPLHGIVFTPEPFRLRLFTQRHIDVISSQTHSPSVARLSNDSFFALFAMHDILSQAKFTTKSFRNSLVPQANSHHRFFTSEILNQGFHFTRISWPTWTR